MKCCDVLVTAKFDDGTTKSAHVRDLLRGKIIDCDTCLDKAYLAAANSCGGEDRVVDMMPRSR